ncbi:MAG TPA: TRAFs-binding domain-containing protein [Pararobbsia sp.]|nr:TRAFs-binding domain-containing protein [Pararobbsia sp.]
MRRHVFVAMPFGTKEGIDFDYVYHALIHPALTSEGLEVFRADQELRAGDIRSDMFQELLLADIVVADVTIDNPNVWYELGVRHALRKRGAIIVSAREERMPFDIVTDRKLRYRCAKNPCDPSVLEHDKARLAEMARETVNAWHGRPVSPVYHLLPYLIEPDWRTLRVGGMQEFWSRHEEWSRQVAVAQRKQRPGDILMLAHEAPIQALRVDAFREAGKALREVGQFDFALEQIDKLLEISPDDNAALQDKGMLLGRLGRSEEAKECLRALTQGPSPSAETFGRLGRVEKDEWVATWCQEGLSPEQRRDVARAQISMLHEAIATYAAGFRLDARHYYCGINAVTLLYLARHLCEDEDDASARDRTEMEGGVRWAARAELTNETPDARNFWARATLAELAALVADAAGVSKAYGYAVAAADQNGFKLDSARQQLRLLAEFGFRPAEIEAALAVINGVKIQPSYRPSKVFLFSGHMIDAPGREAERFPPDMEDLARVEIERALDAFDAREGDLALCEGACGGDLLFAQAALDRKLRVELRLPFDEARFMRDSVAFAGPLWRDRFHAVKKNPLTRLYVMNDELGPGPRNGHPYERANLWQLYTALAWGADHVRMISLWDQQDSGKRGGTSHMMAEVAQRAGQIHTIDARALLAQTHARRATH